VADEDMARLNPVVVADAAYLAEPEAVRGHDLLRAVQFPHGTVGRDAAHGDGRSPELHAGPERTDLRRHQAEVEIADAVEGVADIRDAQIAIERAERRGVVRVRFGWHHPAPFPLRIPVVHRSTGTQRRLRSDSIAASSAACALAPSRKFGDTSRSL